MDKVLVVKAIEPNYNTVSGGPPIMMVGGGRSRGGPAVGRTRREKLGGLAGGTVGVLGALAGKHRSLGGLVQAMISGGAQGKALGGALGRSKLVGVGRQRQARADYDEEARRDYARMGAEGRFDDRRYDVNDRMNPATMRRRVAEVNRDDELAAQQAKEAQAERMARAKAFGTERGEEDRGRADRMAQMEDAFQGAFDPEKQNMFNQRAENVVRVEPAQFEEGQPQETHPNETPVTDAAGRNVGVVGGMGPQLLSLPAPAGGANTEINDIENAGNTEAVQTGTDHERRSTVKVVNPNEEEEEESLENIQQQEVGMQPAGNQQSTVSVVDNMRPSLEQIQRRRQGGN